MAEPNPAVETDPREAAPVVPRVLVFFDYACQFCYLDWPRFKRLREEHEVDIFLVPFELRPEADVRGIPISQAGEGHSERVRAHMQRMAEEGRLTLVHPDFLPNTHQALAVGEFARDIGQDAHEAVHEAIFAAYSGEGLDIGDRATLLRVAGAQGLDTAEVERALDDGRYDERLHQFYHLALTIGISATPSAVICNELLIGSRPYEVLRASVERCMAGEGPVEADEPSEGFTRAEGAPPTIG